MSDQFRDEVSRNVMLGRQLLVADAIGTKYTTNSV